MWLCPGKAPLRLAASVAKMRQGPWHRVRDWRGRGSPGPHWSGCGQGDGCFLASHLKAQNSEAAGIVRGRDHWYQVGTFGNVLVIELDGHLVVTCGERRVPPCQRFWERSPRAAAWFWEEERSPHWPQPAPAHGRDWLVQTGSHGSHQANAIFLVEWGHVFFFFSHLRYCV